MAVASGTTNDLVLMELVLIQVLSGVQMAQMLVVVVMVMKVVVSGMTRSLSNTFFSKEKKQLDTMHTLEERKDISHTEKLVSNLEKLVQLTTVLGGSSVRPSEDTGGWSWKMWAQGLKHIFRVPHGSGHTFYLSNLCMSF